MWFLTAIPLGLVKQKAGSPAARLLTIDEALNRGPIRHDFLGFRRAAQRMFRHGRIKGRGPWGKKLLNRKTTRRGHR